MLSINRLHNFYYIPELHDMRCKNQLTPLEGMDNEQIKRFALFLFEEDQNKSKRLDEMIVRLSTFTAIYNTFIETCKQAGVSFRITSAGYSEN